MRRRRASAFRSYRGPLAAIAVLCWFGLAAGPSPATPRSQPSGSARVRLVQIASLEQPIGAFSRAGDKALYLIEKGGRLKTYTVDDGLRVALDLSKKVSTQNERGLLGIAFPSDNAKAFLSYTDRVGTVTVSEFTFDGAVLDPGSERVLLRIKHPNDDHNGGALAFDPDGLLYIGVGDGGGVGTKGGVGDRSNNAQNLSVLLGKILRIDPQPSAALPYTIPPGNPFVQQQLGSTRKARPEIWALGLRNPWRLTIVGDEVWVPDVGQASWEEINVLDVARGGANLGWRLREGNHPYRGGGKPKGAVDPVFEYAHDQGRCAVIGGVVAPPNNGTLSGSYVFGDLCSGRFMRLVADPKTGKRSMTELEVRLAYLTSIGVGPDAKLVATSLNGGVYRLEPAV